MSPEIEKEFFERWPDFFIHKDDPMKSLMRFGFACEDGWLHIIFRLLSELEVLTANSIPGDPLQVKQVKQKFGELRVYTNWSTNEIESVIEAARQLSRRTCERCGQPETLLVSAGWWETRCASCTPDARGSDSGARTEEPQVGVFWLFRSRLVIKGTDLNNAERWGEYLNAPSHEAAWTQCQRECLVPNDVEYDNPPRGRVVFDPNRQQFHLYADTCILNIPEFVDEIRRRLNLPASTQVGPDDHYRCSRCARSEE